jgi:ankyrin repeat protein
MSLKEDLLKELQIAAVKGDEGKVEALLAQEPELLTMQDEYGKTVLHNAAYHGHHNVVETLLLKDDKNRVTKIQDKQGETGLHESAWQGHDKVSAMLLKDSDVKIQNAFGQTPLHLAIVRGYRKVVALLLETDCGSVTVKDWLGNTPLDTARFNRPWIRHFGKIMSLHNHRSV